MRLRNVKYARELIESYPNIVIDNPKKHAGLWRDVFRNDKSINLEIGCGKGKFIYEKAENNSEENFIGIEKFDSVIVRALEKAIIMPLSNLKLIRFDAYHLDEIFKDNEISNIYLNFSDPWPKKRQAKRRLTSPHFLKNYKKILSEDGRIYIKTDNYGLFEYSMMTLNDDEDYIIEEIMLDMYKTLPQDNVQTEFEIRFIKLNKPIYYIKAKLKGEK
ncbi:MAG: tRNA (guanosine(46)-N7)-methyltransferase TrmB [Candidatus Izemoplasmatales bacterium]|nr:tRNA (guanosine(46)-N7)-methyltransferase TrmB [Candidatus Izemoplasmatales bacterium]MDD4068928.1 tRNA (guanosine(46)-N7)-methyltransferase TrmB [Candidatus Izemoplasmatales bacterium]